jgi:hypothetical protein
MRTILYSLSTLFTFLIFASCTKVQLAEEQQENIAAKTGSIIKSSCQALTFNAQSLSDPDYSYSNFTKTIDASTGKVSSIEVGIYSGGGISEWIKFSLIYNNKNIALVHAENSLDTVINIKLNNEGFADYTVNGNAPNENYLPTRLKYKSGKLIKRSISFNSNTLVANFSYDQNGNLILMQDLSLFGEVPGRSEFTYDLARTGKNQDYFDEPRGFAENTYMLLQYLSLLPLTPTNVRTGSKVYWEDDYLVSNSKLTDHVFDSNGNLVSYKSASPESGTSISQFTSPWSCGTTTAEKIIE